MAGSTIQPGPTTVSASPISYDSSTSRNRLPDGSGGAAFSTGMRSVAELPSARQTLESSATTSHDPTPATHPAFAKTAARRHMSHRTESSSSTPRTLQPSSTATEEGEGVGTAPKGRHRKQWPGVPYVRRPNKGDEAWLPPHRLATNWINLFYDLSVASVLSTFANAHEVGTPSAIITFISYFTIIQWIWATQTFYDIRFQAEDVVHRVYKAAQICLFVYIGAASRRWDLSKLRDPDTIDNISDTDYIARLAARESFTTVIIAFILSRALLAIQYAMSATVGRQAGRRVRFQISSLLILVISTVLTIVALAIPASSTALVGVKIALVYLSIVVECVVIVAQLTGSLRHHISVADVAERYGDLTLIILGEGGFNSLTRAFNYALSGLSDRSKTTFAQVFLAIGIMFMLYMFLFSWFEPEEAITEKRALAWQALHLPMHLVILLLLSAMVNTVVVISYSHGLDLVATAFGQTLDAIVVDIPISDHERAKIDRYLTRLNLNPDWDTEFAYLADLVNINITVGTPDPYIISRQYFGQVVTQTTLAYGLQLSDVTNAALSDLTAINVTTPADFDLLLSRQDQSDAALGRLLEQPLSEALSGTLWLFPFAGAALIFAAARSSLWYRFSGTGHYIMHGGMVVAGVALALLGLLDIGQKRVKVDLFSDDTFVDMDSVAPMYLLVDLALPLVIVLFVYALVYFGATVTIAWRRRRGLVDESTMKNTIEMAEKVHKERSASGTAA